MSIPQIHAIGEFVQYQLTTDLEGAPVIDVGKILNVYFHPHGDGIGTWYAVTGCAYKIPHRCIIKQLGEQQ